MKLPDARPEWELNYIRTEDIDRFWPWLGPFFDRACAKVETDLTPGMIRERAKENGLRFWVVHDGLDGAPIAAFAAGEHGDKSVEIFALSGSRAAEWLPFVVEQFCAMAKRAGLDRLTMAGRSGWLKRLSPLGFVFVAGDGPDRVIMEKVF